jgi:hypothetical protein
MNLTLNVWRQKNAEEPGGFVSYEAKDIHQLHPLRHVMYRFFLAEQGKQLSLLLRQCRQLLSK